MRRGNCVGLPARLFFPSRGQSSTAAAAKRVCAGCAVLAECRHHGLHIGDEGIWGGLSDRDRQRERKRLGIVLHNNIPADSEEEQCERAS